MRSKKSFKRDLRMGVLVSLLGLVLAGFQNCSKTQFGTAAALKVGASDDDSTGVDTDTGASSCRTQLRQITTPLRMYFVVDVSGSNAKNGSREGTDPDKTVRSGAMTRFFNSYSLRSNFSWGLITFASNNARSLAANQGAEQMVSALEAFASVNDEGNTPYIQAIDELQRQIDLDQARTPETKYVVLFLSDGVPNPSVSNSTLETAVTTLVNRLPGQISFNTLYYGPANTDATSRLRLMASRGGGNFLDTNANGTGSSFLVTDLIQLPGVICD